MFHGNKKKEKKPLTEEETKGIEDKLNKIKLITEGILKKKQEKDYSEKQLDNLLKSSVLMPDFYSLWNYRKDILVHFKGIMEPQKFYEFIQKEIKAIMPVMLKNPKSYVLWFHRIWLLKMAAEFETISNITLEKSLLTGEICLCDNFLIKDERNFHCWNYRMKIFSLIEQFFPDAFPNFLQKELEFTIQLIKKNFSNFSAWHYRTKIIPFHFKLNQLHFQSQESLNYLKEDLEYITNAIFTAPTEQSCWNYHHWIINNLIPIYVEKISYHNETVSILFSNIFRIKDSSSINLYCKNNLIDGFISSTEKIYGNKLEIKITDKNWDKLIILSLEGSEVKDSVKQHSEISCFTKHSVSFPKISISKGENDKLTVEFVYNSEDYKKLFFEFLTSQLKVVDDLINIEEKDKSFFYEFARYRKAQIETFILFTIYNPLIPENKNEAELLITKIKNQYKILIENSRRLKNMYETLLTNFKDSISEYSIIS